MRLSEKSPLWNWSEVVAWLYDNKIINDKELVEKALFFANINAALDEHVSPPWLSVLITMISLTSVAVRETNVLNSY
jgi:hypothetical protein